MHIKRLLVKHTIGGRNAPGSWCVMEARKLVLG